MVAARFFFSFFLLWCYSLSSTVLFVGSEPDKLEDTVLALLNKAQSRIWVAMYRLTSAACVHALIAAKHRGVQVQILLDKGMLDLPVYSFVRRTCAAAGIELFWGGGQSLMHHKMAIIDNTLLIGSVNWTRSGFDKNHENSLQSNDAVLVQIAVTHYRVLLKRSAGLRAASPRYSDSFFFVPDHRRAVKCALLNAFAQAQHRILVVMYALTSSWCWQAFTEAAARGVAVRVILEPSQITDEKLLKRARLSGVVVEKYRPPSAAGIAHDKSIIVDDALWLGSMNMTGAGTRMNDENILRVSENGVVSKAAQCFEQLWHNSVKRSLPAQVF